MVHEASCLSTGTGPQQVYDCPLCDESSLDQMGVVAPSPDRLLALDVACDSAHNTLYIGLDRVRQGEATPGTQAVNSAVSTFPLTALQRSSYSAPRPPPWAGRRAGRRGGGQI